VVEGSADFVIGSAVRINERLAYLTEISAGVGSRRPRLLGSQLAAIATERLDLLRRC
jgi:hypothetical protein